MTQRVLTINAFGGVTRRRQGVLYCVSIAENSGVQGIIDWDGAHHTRKLLIAVGLRFVRT